MDLFIFDSIPFEILPALLVLLFLSLVIFTVGTLVLFIRKLMKVYNEQKSEEQLISSVTKLTIVTVSSISITLMVPVIIVLFEAVGVDEFVVFVMEKYVILCDIYTNLWCALLSTRYFDAHYKVLCGCVDAWCKKCFYKSKDEKMIESVVESNESKRTNSV